MSLPLRRASFLFPNIIAITSPIWISPRFSHLSSEARGRLTPQPALDRHGFRSICSFLSDSFFLLVEEPGRGSSFPGAFLLCVADPTRCAVSESTFHPPLRHAKVDFFVSVPATPYNSPSSSFATTFFPRFRCLFFSSSCRTSLAT